MLLVKTVIKPSPIHGLGVFVDDFIPIRTKVGLWMPDFDRAFETAQFEGFPEVVQKYVRHYGYRDSRTGLWHLNSDNMRFFNHSDNPNTIDDDEGQDWAKRDILTGEELTCNYRRFDLDANRKLGSL
jgi:hypothetical protein